MQRPWRWLLVALAALLLLLLLAPPLFLFVLLRRRASFPFLFRGSSLAQCAAYLPSPACAVEKMGGMPTNAERNGAKLAALGGRLLEYATAAVRRGYECVTKECPRQCLLAHPSDGAPLGAGDIPQGPGTRELPGGQALAIT